MRINQLELLELFYQEPNVIDADAEIYQYIFTDSKGYVFTLYVSAHEDTIVIRLEHNELKFSIFDVAIRNVTEIKIDGQKLLLIRNESILASLLIRPNISLNLDIQCPR